MDVQTKHAANHFMMYVINNDMTRAIMHIKRSTIHVFFMSVTSDSAPDISSKLLISCTIVELVDGTG